MSSRTIAVGVVRGAYPERVEERLSKLDEVGERVLHAAVQAVRARLHPWTNAPERVAAFAHEFEGSGDAELAGGASALRAALRERGFADDLVAKSFALVREVASRKLGERHFDVQLIGGWVLLRGMVAEMETGEGKTLTATLPACTAALAGVPVHVITVNDYLARRDAEWMGPIYRALGLSTGRSASRSV